jgi:acetate kinase
MPPAPASVLAINGGSSSIKFAVYRAGTSPTLSLSGTLDRIGRSGATLSWRAKEGASVEGHTEVPDDTPAPRLLIDWLEAREEFADVSAVGHRVVHGMAHTEPTRATSDVVEQLDRFHLVADVIDRVPALNPRAAYAQQTIRDTLIEHKQYIAKYGEDMPEIRNWRWSLSTAAQSARGRSGAPRRKRS